MLERDFGYKPPIPDSQRKEYEAALMRVQRWKSGNWREDILENDWDHVRSMFKILSDINKACPGLFSEVDKPTVEHMIYIHDVGEIAVGDLPYDIDNYDALRPQHKRKEDILARWMIRSRIEDRQIRSHVLKLYSRYIAQKEDDKEALLVEFVDKLQGLRFGFENVFNAKELKMNSANRQMRFNRTLHKFLVPPLKSLLKLVSPETQDDLKAFLRSELEGFSESGYQKEAAPYIENLDAILR